MASKEWVIFSQGDLMGPMATQAVKVMLKQGRLDETEFIWCEGMARWERIRDVYQFGREKLPPYPDVDLPPNLESFQVDAVNEDSESENVEDLDDTENEVEAMYEAEAEAEAEDEEAYEVPVAAPAPRPRPVATAKVQRVRRSAPPIQNASKHRVRPAPPKGKHSAPPTPAKVVPIRSAGNAPKKKKPVVEEVTASRKRYNPRAELDGYIQIHGHNPMPVVNIGATGVLVECDKEIPLGTPVRFELVADELEKSPFKMTGVVVRTLIPDGINQFAIEFTRVNPVYKPILNAFLAKQG